MCIRDSRYVVNAREGQILSARVTDVTGPVVMDIRFPGGELIDDASQVLAWEGQLPVGGDFIVDVRCAREASFTLQIAVE
ncbi:serine/threonine protein kinase, partial [filamentous cyanobacterium CCP5]